MALMNGHIDLAARQGLTVLESKVQMLSEVVITLSQPIEDVGAKLKSDRAEQSVIQTLGGLAAD